MTIDKPLLIKLAKNLLSAIVGAIIPVLVAFFTNNTEATLVALGVGAGVAAFIAAFVRTFISSYDMKK